MDYNTHFLKYTRFFMILIGIMEPKLPNTCLSYVYRTWVILIQSLLILSCLSLLMGIQYMTVDDILRKDALGYLRAVIMILVKVVFARTDTMRKVIKEMFKLEDGIDKDDEGVNRKYLKWSRYNSKIFRIVAYIYIGVLCQLFWLMKYNWATKTLFFTAWFPFDRANYYTPEYVFQIVSAIIVMCYDLTFDTLFTAIIIFPSMLLDILGHKFKHFDEYCKEQLGQPKLVLRQLIIEHKEIIRYVGELDSSLKWFFFIDFLVKSYNLTLMVISLISVSDGMDITVLFFLFKMAYRYMEAWCLYYHGNELMIESSNITNRIAESNWYEYDLVVKKMFIIIMLRSSKPLALHLGVFQDLSNEILVKFFKAAYSVIVWSDIFRS